MTLILGARSQLTCELQVVTDSSDTMQGPVDYSAIEKRSLMLSVSSGEEVSSSERTYPLVAKSIDKSTLDDCKGSHISQST